MFDENWVNPGSGTGRITGRGVPVILPVTGTNHAKDRNQSIDTAGRKELKDFLFLVCLAGGYLIGEKVSRSTIKFCNPS
jgi:hypothetical protein